MCRCQIRTAKRYYAESHEGRSHDSRQTARKIDKQCRASRTLESFQREALRKHGRRARDKPEGARSQTLREHEGNSSSRTSVKNEGGGNATAEIEGEGNATAANKGGRGGNVCGLDYLLHRCVIGQARSTAPPNVTRTRGQRFAPSVANVRILPTQSATQARTASKGQARHSARCTPYFVFRSADPEGVCRMRGALDIAHVQRESDAMRTSFQGTSPKSKHSSLSHGGQLRPHLCFLFCVSSHLLEEDRRCHVFIYFAFTC